MKKKGFSYGDALNTHSSYIINDKECLEMMTAYNFLYFESISTGNEISYYFEDSNNTQGWLTINDRYYAHLAENETCTSLAQKKKNSLNSTKDKLFFEILMNDFKKKFYEMIQNFKKNKIKPIQRSKLLDFDKIWERIPLEFVISLSSLELLWFMETLEYLDKYEKIFVNNRVRAIDVNFINYFSETNHNSSIKFNNEQDLEQEIEEDLKMIKGITYKLIPDSIFEHFSNEEVDNLQTKLGEDFLLKSLISMMKLNNEELLKKCKEYARLKKNSI